MPNKSQQYVPSQFDAKTRRAAAHSKKVKMNKARDDDWKQDVMQLFGYAKPDVNQTVEI